MRGNATDFDFLGDIEKRFKKLTHWTLRIRIFFHSPLICTFNKNIEISFLPFFSNSHITHRPTVSIISCGWISNGKNYGSFIAQILEYPRKRKYSTAINLLPRSIIGHRILR